MFTKESLLTIPELKLGSKLSSMSESQFGAYINDLNAFIDGFPALTDRMRQTLNASSYNLLAVSLMDTAEMLDKIYATDIAKDARNKAGALKANGDAVDHDATEAYVERFILNVSSLSIDIQMAAHKKPVAAAPAPKRSVPTIFTAGLDKSPAPAPPDSAGAKTKSGAPMIFTAGSSQSTAILAVDNAIMFLNTLKKLLKDSPYDVHCATSGTEALEYIQTNRPGLFLLDIEMPDMDGYELARRIKSYGHTAPIIFVTANSARMYVDKAIAVGASGLLMKPLRANQLLAKLKEFI
ncbi:MAG: response regulator [Oscillospiraceae bacterium]|jgi:CheY-like chemotaxis protein|nr:response regulator [Oscillospiraceae bacterium]